MKEAVQRVVALCLGALAILTDAIRARRARTTPEAHKLLQELASEKSASVLDLSSHANIAQPAALAILIELEESGLVRLSADKGPEHVRIAAITEAGREQVA